MLERNSVKNICKMILVFCLLVNINLYSQPRLIVVEGNIGVGKTTFLKMLSSFLQNANIISEACDEWQNISGYNLLDAYYKNNCRWACTFQLYVLMTGIRKLQNAINDNCDLYIMERSLYSSKYCFVKNLVSMGTMNELEWALYSDFWSWCSKQVIKPSAIIYLKADPEICYERMKKRARSEESIVPLKYLQRLHDLHNEWLICNKCNDFENIPVIVLDASKDIFDDVAFKEEYFDKVDAFINKL